MITPSDLVMSIGRDHDKKTGEPVGPQRYMVKPHPGNKNLALVAQRFQMWLNGREASKPLARKFIAENPWIHDAKRV